MSGRVALRAISGMPIRSESDVCCICVATSAISAARLADSVTRPAICTMRPATSDTADDVCRVLAENPLIAARCGSIAAEIELVTSDN